MFGNNDTVTSSRDVKLGFGFEDGDTRTVSLPNSRTNLTDSELQELSAWVNENKPVIGDRAGASTTGIFEAYTQTTTKRQLDLT